MKCKECDNKFCARLTEDVKKLLCPHATIITQKKKHTEYFYSYKDCIEIILEGYCYVQTYSANGKRLFVTLMAPGDIIGSYLDFVDNADAQIYDIVAITDVKKCIVPKEIYFELIKSDYSFSNAIIRSVIDQSSRMAKYTVLHSLNGNERISFILDELKRLDLKDLNSITQEDIAFIAGVSRVTLFRAMKEILSEDGNIKK